MRTYKVNLPEGTKKKFGALRGVKVRLVSKNTKKKNTLSAYNMHSFDNMLYLDIFKNLQ